MTAPRSPERQRLTRPGHKSRQWTTSCPRRRLLSSFSHRSGYQLLTRCPSAYSIYPSRNQTTSPSTDMRVARPLQERPLAGRLQYRAVTVSTVPNAAARIFLFAFPLLGPPSIIRQDTEPKRTVPLPQKVLSTIVTLAQSYTDTLLAPPSRIVPSGLL
jgi:hypothetical protein